MARTFTVLAALMGLLGVLAGTFGAHGLERHARPQDLAVWETAARYQMYHALALLWIAWAAERFDSKAVRLAGWMFVAGIVVFSGSLYALALSERLTGDRQSWLGMITPIGGFCFIAGWAMLAIGAYRAPLGREAR